MKDNSIQRMTVGAAVAAILGTIVLASPPISAAEVDDGLEEVTVTGSRIKRQDFTANSPIVTIDTTTFEETSTIGIETILNQLPQFVPGVTGAAINGALEFNTGGSQFSSGGIEANAFQTPGASTVNLRGLGAGRNLVLIDGRRGMPINSTMTVDLNSIPSSAIDRVEIISGGASATYGADAVAGALNFILKDNFEGFDVDANYGITQEGDSEEYRISALFGASSADGRGNLMLGMEMASREAGDLNDRDWFLSDRSNPNVGGTDFFYSDTYLAPNFTTFNLPSGAAINGLFPGAPPGSINSFQNFYVNRTTNGTGTIYTGPVVFGGAARAGAYKYTGPLDVDGFPFRKLDPLGGIAQNQIDNPIAVPLERYSMFARGRYDINDSITAFTTLTFARGITETSSQFSPAVPGWAVDVPHGTGIYANSFANPAAAITGYNPTTGAPIYSTTAATAAAYLPGGALGLNCGPIGGCTNSQVFPKPAEVNTLLNSRSAFGSGFGGNPNADATVGRVLDFLGERTTRNTTTNFQMIAGLKGDFSNGMYWDASASHGQSEAHSQLINFGSVERYRAIARSPNYGRAFTTTGNAAGGNFGGGTATCTSGLPLFADFQISDDCLNAIRTTLSQTGEMTQDTFEANLGGNLFEMPAGPLQYVLGVNYRKNDYQFRTADNNRDINFVDTVMGLFPAGDTIGSIAVREVYGELLVPVVKDGPVGMRALSLELGGRYSDYDTSGGVSTAKALIDWTVLDWARFRGGWQQATRAPNIYELFTGRSLSIFSAGSSQGDVCSLNNFDSDLSAATGTQPGSGATAPSTAAQAAQTRSLCEQLMGPGAAQAYYSQAIVDQPDPGGSGSVWITGNPNVEPETANTWTAGLVVTSMLDNPWLRGLSGSVDWFQIEVEDVVAQSTATLVTERCFSLEENPTGDVNNQWCQNVGRHPQTGAAFSTDVTFTNESWVKLSGIDFQLNWAVLFADLGWDVPGRFGMNILATVPLEISTQTTPESPKYDWVGHQGAGECPSGISCSGYDYQIFGTFNYSVDRLGVSMRWQHYPSIKSGALVANPNSTALGVHSSYDVFALTANYRINDTFMIRGGIENLFDKDPPLAGGNPNAANFPEPATHTSGGIYDPYGRRFFFGVNMSF